MANKLDKSWRKFNKKKQDNPILYSGELGVPLNGQRVVEVPNRRGFVFVRLKGNTSELIQAYNFVVSPIYGLPVLVGRQGNIYRVVGRNLERYQDWGNAPYLPKHGAQHSFNHDLGIGGDVVWVYSQQFMPLLSYPSGTSGDMTLSLNPHFYEWQGSWRFAQTTGVPNYTPYLPTITGSARMVLSYIDPSDNSIKLVPGTPFSNTITGSAQIAQYIPDIPRSIGVPLAAVRLTTGTTAIGWDAVYDMRDFFTVGNTITGSVASVDTIGFAGLDEGVPIGTGTILNVTGDLSLTRSGTMFNLSYTSAGGPGGGGAGVMVWDEGVPLVTGTVLNFVGNGVTATASGSVVRVDIPGGRTLIEAQTPRGTGSVVFTSIPQIYQKLIVEFAARSTQSADTTTMDIVFNNDTTDANYRQIALGWYASTTLGAGAAGDNNIISDFIMAATGPASRFTMSKIEIPWYSSSIMMKQVFAYEGKRLDTATNHEHGVVRVMEWESASAITSLALPLAAGNYVTGTMINLYGEL